MLTPEQAEAAATALAMHPEAKRGDMLTCPACEAAAISATGRRHMGIFNRTPCPHCGALLRLRWGRALFTGYLLVLGIAAVAGYVTWPTDRHLVQTYAAPFIVMMFTVLATTVRRLPLTFD
jgi:hypothetical protein